VVATTNGGKDDSQLKDHIATFASGTVTFKSKDGKEQHVAAYTLDTSKKPAAIDFVPADGPHKGITLKAIYVVQKKELKLCVGKEGGDRPTTFRSKAGEETVLFVLKMDEPKQTATPEATTGAGTPGKPSPDPGPADRTSRGQKRCLWPKV